MQTYGLRRAMKLYASQVRRDARRAVRHDKIRRICQLHEQSEALLKVVRAQHTPPIPEDMTKLVDALMSQTTPKESDA